MHMIRLLSTSELIRRCVQKDRSAWDEFTRRYYPLVKRAALYRLHNNGIPFSKHDIDDIAQDVFTHLIEKDLLNTVQDTRRIDYWIAMISANRAINFCRRIDFRGNKRSVSLDEVTQGPDRTYKKYEHLLCGAKLSPEKILSSTETTAIVENCLNKLGHRARLALQLYYFEEKPIKDIADILDIPLNTAGTLLRRAREKLKELLAGEV